MHLSGTSTPQITTGRVFEDPTGGVGNDGNFVSLDREAAKAASNQVRYDVVSVLVQAELSDLAFAAGDGKAG
jgi:flagellar basal body rod protein FlgB